MAAVSAPNPLAAAATAAATSSRGPLVTLELSSRSTATAVATSDAAGTPAPEGAVDAFGKRHKRAVYPSERTKTFTDAAYSIFVTILAVPLATIEDSEGKTSAQLLAERFLPVTVFALSSVLVVVHWMTHVRSFAGVDWLDEHIEAANHIHLVVVSLLPATYGFTFTFDTTGAAFAVYMSVQIAAQLSLVLLKRRLRCWSPMYAARPEAFVWDVVLRQLCPIFTEVISIVLFMALDGTQHVSLGFVTHIFQVPLAMLVGRLIVDRADPASMKYLREYRKAFVMPKARMEAMCDGIFAICGTLIVLEIHTTRQAGELEGVGRGAESACSCGNGTDVTGGGGGGGGDEGGSMSGGDDAAAAFGYWDLVGQQMTLINSYVAAMVVVVLWWRTHHRLLAFCGEHLSSKMVVLSLAFALTQVYVPLASNLNVLRSDFLASAFYATPITLSAVYAHAFMVAAENATEPRSGESMWRPDCYWRTRRPYFVWSIWALPIAAWLSAAAQAVANAESISPAPVRTGFLPFLFVLLLQHALVRYFENRAVSAVAGPGD